MKPYKRPESVLVVVYSEDARVLMLERCQPEGFWQSVTGSLEWGEAPMDTACRELHEETGLEGDAIAAMNHEELFPIHPAWRHRYAPEVTENREYWFSVKLPQPGMVTLSQREHRQYRWLPWKEAAALATSWTNRDAILKIFAGHFSE